MKIKLLPLKSSLISRKPYKTYLNLLENKFAGIRIFVCLEGSFVRQFSEKIIL